MSERRNPILVGLVMLSIAVLVSPPFASASPGGIAGRTLKSSASGCGSCHGSSSSPSVVVTINGPDTVLAGQTVTYSIDINSSSGSTGGVDVASSTGTIAPVSSTLKALSGEVVQRVRLTVPGSFQFSFTAPGVPGSVILYATAKGSGMNSWNWAPNKTVVVRTSTGVDGKVVPNNLVLAQNYPNPFNPSTLIEYTVPSREFVSLRVYDLAGKEVAVLVHDVRESGTYRTAFNNTTLASGVYVYRLLVSNRLLSRKMLLIR